MKIRNIGIFFVFCLLCTQMVFSRQTETPEAVQFAQLSSLYSSSFWPALEQQAGVFSSDFPDSSFLPRVRFMRAVAYFHLERYELAVSLLELPADSQKTPEAFYWLGRSYFELGKFERSLEPLYSAASSFESGSILYCSALYYACRSLTELGKTAEAVPVLEYLITVPEIGADFFETALLLLTSYERQKQYEKIISLYNKLNLADFPPKQAELASYICAGAFAASGDYERALAVFAPLTAVLRENGAVTGLQNEFLLRLAVRSFDQKDYKTALEYFGRIEKSGDRDSSSRPLVVLYEAEICLITENNPQKALSLLSQNLSSSGSYRLWFLAASAKYAVLNEKYSEALDFCLQAESLLKSGTDTSFTDTAFLSRQKDIRPEILYWHMRALYGLKDYAAVSSLASAKPLSELEPDTVRLYALSLAAQASYAKAVPLFEDLYAKTRLVSDGLNLASAYLRVGNNTAAFRTASALAGQDAAYIAGLAAYNLQNWSACEKLLSSVSQPEKQPYARYYGALSAYRLEKFAAAADAFAAFLKDFPRSSLYWNAAQTGTQAALQAERPAQALYFAETAYKNAVSQDSKIQSALVLSGIYADSGKTAQAVSLLKPLSEGETPGALQCLFALGDLYASSGNVTAADDAWRVLLQKNPSAQLAEDTAFRRAELFYESGDSEKVLERLSLYAKNWPRGRYADAVKYFTAMTLYKTGDTDQAILLWLELLSAYPKSVYVYNTLQNLTAAYRTNGEYQQALGTAEELLKKFGSQARSDGVDREVQELKLLASGVDKKAAALFASYERAGKDTTEEGRVIALDLAAYYLSNPARRSEGLTLLKTVLQKSSDRLPRERTTAARAALMLGNAYREEGKFAEAAPLLLTAAEYYAPLDTEKTAQALYGAAESFDRTGSLADAKSTLETMRSMVPTSVWTQRAESLIGGNE